MIVVLYGKSLSGKSTVLRSIVESTNLIKPVKKVITDTTREPREGEVDGRDYNFRTNDNFEEYIKLDRYIEHVRHERNGEIEYYGTPVDSFEDSDKNKIIILDLDGVRSLKSYIKHRSVIDPDDVKYVFLDIPLKERLKATINDMDDLSKESLEDLIKRVYRDEDKYTHEEMIEEADLVLTDVKLEPKVKAIEKLYNLNMIRKIASKVGELNLYNMLEC